MLPDYPRVKTDLAAFLEDFLRQRVEVHLGPLGEIPRERVPEGDGHALERPTGEVTDVPFEELRSGFSVKTAEIPTLSLQAVLEKFDQAAQELADQMVKNMYKSIHQAVEQVGNTVSAKGRLSAETILEMLARISIDFSPDGKPQLPQIHLPPNLADTMQRALAELEENQVLKKQFLGLIQEKKEEWRAREASRKLVG